MVFSPINHHNHNNHWAVLGFCWVSSVMLFCVESELFDLKVCGETGNNSCRSWQSLCGLWFTAIWIVFYFNLQMRNSWPLYRVSSLENRREKLPPSGELWEADLLPESWLGQGQEVLINVFSRQVVVLALDLLPPPAPSPAPPTPSGSSASPPTPPSAASPLLTRGRSQSEITRAKMVIAGTPHHHPPPAHSRSIPARARKFT